MTTNTASHYIQVFGKCMDKPMRLPAFISIAPDLSNDIYWPLFRYVWENTESAFLHVPELRKVITAARTTAPERYQFMTEKETETYRFHKRRGKPVRIYRGAVEANMAGLSWTLNKKKAEWFATRWGNQTPQVLTAEVDPDMVIQWMFGRGEREVLCFPEDIQLIGREMLEARPRTKADEIGLNIQVYGQDVLTPGGEFTKYQIIMEMAEDTDAARAAAVNELSDQALACEGIGLIERAEEIKELICRIQEWEHGTDTDKG